VRFATGLHALQVKDGAPALNLIGKGRFDMGAVDKAPRRHFVEGARLAEELEHRLMPARNDGGKIIEKGKESGPAFDHALVVKGDVEIGILIADLSQAGLEILEVAPNVAVVGAKSCEIDIREEKDAIRDPKPAMPASVARQVDCLDACSSEVESGTIGESDSIRSGREVEFFDNKLFKSASSFALESVDVHQAIHGLRTGQVGLVDVNTSIVKEAIPGEVILVGMAIDHGVNWKWGAAATHDIDRRVDNDGFPLPPDQKAVA
jgi:hypothetical protein